MREFMFIFLYGAVTIAALMLAMFWGNFAARRAKVVPDKWRDRYFLLSFAIAVDAAGAALNTMTRVAANIHYGLSKALIGFEGIIIMFSLAMILMAKLFLVWLADLETDPPRWAFLKGVLILSAAWGAVTAGLVIWDWLPPFDSRPTLEERRG